MITTFGRLAFLALICFFASCAEKESGDANPSTATKSKQPTSPERKPITESWSDATRKTFEVDIPTDKGFRIESAGPIDGLPDTFRLVALNEDDTVQFIVLVLPGLKDYETTEKMAEDWERGAMKNFTKKKSSRMTTLAEKPAYELVASFVGTNGSMYVSRSILVVANRRNYALSVTYEKGKGGAVEIESFFRSFRFRS